MPLTDEEKELNALRFHLGDASPMGRTNTWMEAWDRLRGRFGAGTPSSRNYRDLKFSTGGEAGGGQGIDPQEKNRQDAVFAARYGMSPQDALEGYRVGTLLERETPLAPPPDNFVMRRPQGAPPTTPPTPAPDVSGAHAGFMNGLKNLMSSPLKTLSETYKTGLKEIPSPEQLTAGLDVGQRFNSLGERITRGAEEPITITPEQRQKAARFSRMTEAPLALTEAKAEAIKNDKGPLNGKITLTPEAIEREGIRYYQTGKLPSLGMGGGADKTAIINFAQKYAKEAGDEPKAMTLRWTQYGANEGAYKRNTQYATQVGQFEVKAKKEFALAKDLAAKVDAKGNDAFSRWKREVLDGKVAGDPDFKNLQASMMTALTEYGKIVGGGALSAQALTDSARKEMEEILKASESAAAIRSRIDNVIMPSMRYQMEAIRETQGGLEDKMGGTAGGKDPLGLGI